MREKLPSPSHLRALGIKLTAETVAVSCDLRCRHGNDITSVFPVTTVTKPQLGGR